MKKFLLLDHEMFHPEVHLQVLMHAENRGWTAEYRRYFPHFCDSDMINNIVMVCGGRAPGVPGAQMSSVEVDRLADYACNGGLLILAAAGGSSGKRGSHERYLFNKILKKSGIAIRINSDWVTDNVNGYPSTLVPSSYLLPLPIIRPFPESPIGHGIDTLYGSYQSSLAVGNDAAVLLESMPTSVLVERTGDFTQANICSEPKAFKLAAAARVGKGYIVVISRFLLSMPYFTGRTSDKPLLNPENLASNYKLVHNLMNYMLDVAGGTAKWKEKTCHEGDKMPEIDLPEFPVNDENISSVPSHCSDWLTGSRPNSSFAHWIEQNKLRIGYDVISSHEEERKQKMQMFHETGLNTYFAFNDAQYLYSSSKSIEEREEYKNQWRYTAELCNREGFKCFLGSMYPHWDIFRNGEYAHLTDASGKVHDAPSALDIQFWKDSVFRIAEDMARISLEQPGVTGLFWDLEMYSFPGLNHQEGQAMEDTCFYTFIEREAPYLGKKLKDEARALKVEKRYAWLRDNGLLRRYYKVLELEVRRLAEELRTTIRDINPELELALYNLYIPNNWFYRGFLSGLSTPERPIILLTYEVCGKTQKRIAAQEGVYYYHCPGCLINALKPDEWEKSLPKLAMEQDGYWLFPVGPLMSHVDHEKLNGDATLNGTRDMEVAGIARANRLLDAMLLEKSYKMYI